MNQRSEWITADEAKKMLGVKAATLYAYASRGLVTSEAGPKGRPKRYARSDLERLAARSAARRGHGPVAASALRWGDPVLATTISTIDERGPRYRGLLAIDLVEKRVGFERVAALLRTGVLPDAAPVAASFEIGKRKKKPPIERLLRGVVGLVGPLAAEVEDADFAARMVATLARLIEPAPAEFPVSTVLAEAFDAGGRAPAIDGIDAALVLSADHELTPSTFVARVAASAGASAPASLIAALATLSGAHHGGLSARVDAFVTEALTLGPAKAVRARIERGEALHGFGLPAYPDGDPRVPPLLARASEIGDSPRLRALVGLVRAMKDRDAPNHDVGLLAIAYALEKGPAEALAMFALGRSAGWLAHIAEQKQESYVIRPRATLLA